MILKIVQILFLALVLAAIYKRDIAIFLYVVFLPINSILPTSYNVFGLVSYPNILSIIALYHLWVWNKEIIESYSRKLAFRIIWIFIIYLVYVDFRHAYLDLLPVYKNLNPYVETLRNLIKWVPLILLIKKMDHEYFNKIVLRAFVVSVGILVFSVAFAMPLTYLGFKVGFSLEFEYRENIRMPVFMRNPGFLDGGDFNVMGAMFNMLLAFCLSYFTPKDLWRKKEALLLAGFSLIGVILTGSRMAVLTLIIVIVYSFVETSSLKNTLRYSLYGITAVLIFWQLGFLDFIIQRFEHQDTLAQLSLNERYSRVNRWISFFNYSTSNIYRFLFGYDSLHYFSGREFRDPHNLFLRMFYFGGFAFVTLFIIQLVKLIKYSIYENTRFRLLLILIPCLISMMIIGQIQWIYFLLLIVGVDDIVT